MATDSSETHQGDGRSVDQNNFLEYLRSAVLMGVANLSPFSSNWCACSSSSFDCFVCVYGSHVRLVMSDENHFCVRHSAFDVMKNMLLRNISATGANDSQNVISSFASVSDVSL